jgi:tight adherence protein C
VLRLVARRLAPAFGPITRVVHGTIARRRSARSTRHLAGDLPLAVDLLAVAVGSGATPFGALEQVVGWVPERVGIAVRRVLAEHRLGVPFGDALDALASSTPSYAPLVDALLAGERLGAPVAPALARVADRLRIEHRRATEARARTVPVKLLFPLVFLVLPAFGLLTVAPALLHAMERL